MIARELTLRSTLPLVINSFNQLTYLQRMVERFSAERFRNLIIVDNGSSYPPLLDYLEQLNQRGQAIVIYYGENRGPHFFFLRGIHRHLFENTPFLFTDPDIELTEISPYFLCRLVDLAKKYREYKVGPALTLPTPEQAKPDLVFRSAVQGVHSLLDWERQFWAHPVEENVYNAQIDTTLHLYYPEFMPPGGELIAGLRVAGPGFEARHLPWFRDDPIEPEELAFYNGLARFSNWGAAQA